MFRPRFAIRSMAVLVSCVALAGAATTSTVLAQPRPSDGVKSGPLAPGAPRLPEIASSHVFAGGPRYETATDGTVYSPLDEPSYILGHDNGQSTLYDNGKGLRVSYWSNGDTLVTRPNGDSSFVGNTLQWTTDLDMSNNVSDWTYAGGADGPHEAWRLNDAEEAWNADREDTDPDTPGCQPGPKIQWMQCGDEYAIWGGGIVSDPKSKRMLSFYSLIKRYHDRAATHPDPTNPDVQIPCTDEDIANRVEDCRAFLFDGDGIGIAEWTESPSDGDGWTRMDIANEADPAKPTALWPYDDDPATRDTFFANAFLVHDGYVYAYGCPGVLFTECQVSRVSLGKRADVYDRAAWRFYAGTDRDRRTCPRLWSPSVACAIAMKVDSHGGPAETVMGGAAGSSVYWNPALEMFMQIYSYPLKNDLMYRVASKPEGPWSEAGLLGMAVPAAGTGLGSISYAGFVHPEFAEKGGLVQYITYAHTTGFLRSDLGIHRVEFKPGTRKR
jgi:Domain of unknown function (DUF4185)